MGTIEQNLTKVDCVETIIFRSVIFVWLKSGHVAALWWSCRGVGNRKMSGEKGG